MPTLVFPCRYAVKALGRNADDFAELVQELVSEHTGQLPAESVSTRLSGGGRYAAVTITFRAASKTQLDAIYSSLSHHERIMMAL